MDEHGLGPNGGMLYCMEYLEKNFDWLEGKLGELGKEDGENGPADVYALFDLPGQVELSTNHESVKRIVDMLQSKCGFRVRIFTSGNLIFYSSSWANTHCQPS